MTLRAEIVRHSSIHPSIHASLRPSVHPSINPSITPGGAQGRSAPIQESCVQLFTKNVDQTRIFPPVATRGTTAKNLTPSQKAFYPIDRNTKINSCKTV